MNSETDRILGSLEKKAKSARKRQIIIGSSLGSIIRKGGFGMPVMISIFFFVFYHIINIIGEKAAKEETLSVLEGMWIANLVFLPIAIFLSYKTSKGIIIFDSSIYTNPFRKLFTRQ